MQTNSTAKSGRVDHITKAMIITRTLLFSLDGNLRPYSDTFARVSGRVVIQDLCEKSAETPCLLCRQKNTIETRQEFALLASLNSCFQIQNNFACVYLN